MMAQSTSSIVSHGHTIYGATQDGAVAQRESDAAAQSASDWAALEADVIRYNPLNQSSTRFERVNRSKIGI